MNVAVTLEFKADRKEPLGDLIRRVAAAFEQAGLEPRIMATFSDGPAGIGTTSAVERAIKKHPYLARFDASPTVTAIGLAPPSPAPAWFEPGR